MSEHVRDRSGGLASIPPALPDVVVGFGPTIAVTRPNLIMAVCGLALFGYLYADRGYWLFGLGGVSVVLPLALAVRRAWAARRGQVEHTWFRHPFDRRNRAYLWQGLNIWVCCVLLGGVVAAGGTHFARIGFSLTAGQFGVVVAAFSAGLVLLAGLAFVPRRRVQVATNLVMALLSGFLAVQLVQISVPRSDPIVLDLPLAGEWSVLNGGQNFLLNGHSPNESNAVDLLAFGDNGRTHSGGAGAPLTSYAGFGSPVFAPADGRIVEVNGDFPDTPPGINGDRANSIVQDIGGGRYVVMAHLKRGSITVQAGDLVRRGQPLAAVGNSGHTNEPHLHLQVQDNPTGDDAVRTFPMVFRDVSITRNGPWPRADSRELRTGDLVRRLSQ